MKKSAPVNLTLYATIFGLCLPNMIPVSAATRYSMQQKNIILNGQVVSRPQGFVSNGTTFMPIYYVMQALEKLGINNTWNGSTWNLSTGKAVQVEKAAGSGKSLIEANGKALYRVNGIVAEDTSSHSNTTYMPVWYVMQVITDVGVKNTWDGTNWTVSGATTAGASGSSGDTVPSKFSNQAVNDTSYWKRASRNLYLMASTDGSFSQTGTKQMLQIEPGQSVYLMGYSGTENIDAKPTWYVNSPDATITNDSPGGWTYGNYDAKSAVFEASKPGVYTVQFSANGSYSVPLVLIVGMSSLTGSNISVAASSSGVEPLPSGLPSVLPETVDNVTFYPYRAISGWLPVSGHVSGGASTVVIDLVNGTGDEWNYVLPVQNGVFKGMVRVPFEGNVEVSFVPDFWQTLNQSNGAWSTNATYFTDITTFAPMELDKALLASAMMDWNMSSEFNVTASILADNSPSKDTAIAAIANYATEKVVYDYADYNANKFIWKNSTDVWGNPLGVCEDISELTASMLKSIGIPAETLVGTAPKNSTPDDHEWLRAFDGASWLVIDPTWNGSGGDINSSLLNEYMTSTDSLTSNHVLDPKQSYTWQ